MTAQATTADVQKQYLAGVQYLFEQGVCSVLHCVPKKRPSMQLPISLSNIKRF